MLFVHKGTANRAKCQINLDLFAFPRCSVPSKLCFKGSVNWPKNKEKAKNLRFFINFPLKILVVPEKVVPLHPQNRTSEFSSKKLIGVWCNGNTADSGPAFPGSSPGTPTK